MRAGVIIGSALAGAAAGAILTLNDQEKEKVIDLFNTLKNKALGLKDDVTDRITGFGQDYGIIKQKENNKAVKSQSGNFKHQGKKTSNKYGPKSKKQ